MRFSHLTSQETQNLTDLQLFSLESGIAKGHYNLKEIGDLVPGAIMVHDLSRLSVTYMNTWGCEVLNHSMDEINEMGEEYYKKFFMPEESRLFMEGMANFYKHEDYTGLYSFFHRVRTGKKMEPSWYYAVSRFLRDNTGTKKTTELILVANPVSGMGSMVNKVSQLLNENVFVSKNYQKFTLLTKREKEIIILLAEGKTTPDIADILFISSLTVSTHRKNITKKLDIHSLAGLIKFAIAFDMISY